MVLDGVAQPHVGGNRLLDQAFLLGDVDSDDQMQARLTALADQFSGRAARPNGRRRDACEGVVNRGHLGFGKFGGEFVELDIVRCTRR